MALMLHSDVDSSAAVNRDEAQKNIEPAPSMNRTGIPTMMNRSQAQVALSKIPLPHAITPCPRINQTAINESRNSAAIKIMRLTARTAPYVNVFMPGFGQKKYRNKKWRECGIL